MLTLRYRFNCNIGLFFISCFVYKSSRQNRGSVGGYFLAGRNMHWAPVRQTDRHTHTHTHTHNKSTIMGSIFYVTGIKISKYQSIAIHIHASKHAQAQTYTIHKQSLETILVGTFKCITFTSGINPDIALRQMSPFRVSGSTPRWQQYDLVTP